MKFSIITTTFKNSEALSKTVASLTSQTYTDWELIIVNDSPFDTSYHTFASSINDPRIHYHVNNAHEGENVSRNIALSKISAHSTWVIPLSDGDYMLPYCLTTYVTLITAFPHIKWFGTNIVDEQMKSRTYFKHNNLLYTYTWSYLIGMQNKGMFTSCIETKLLLHSKILFSKFVAKGADWFFLYRVSVMTKLYYHNHNSVVTTRHMLRAIAAHDGTPVNNTFETISTLLYEGTTRKLIFYPSFSLYILIRYIRLLLLKR